ncbi:MAG: gamma-glutamyltransferase, partial [Gammaproteobacteria bacterium]|nr:gamma-glutamyltransferase [Gammaproteobacteria bacterium]
MTDRLNPARVFARPGTALAAALVVFACLQSAHAADPVRGEQQMVVAANPYATEAGIEILRAGGSAVDAAITVQLVLSMVEPQSSGIGGGAFLLHTDTAAAGDEAVVTVYSGRETAPAGAGPAMFAGDGDSPPSFTSLMYGGLPVGVPGAMRMLEMAHRDHGRLPWADLFEPAIELAENGFEISPRLYF